MADTKIYLFLFLLVRETASIHVNDGGYEDVHIFVRETNDEKDGNYLLKRIQDVFTEASKLMFTATRQKLFFKNIRIVVPKSWSFKPGYKKKAVPSLYKQYIVVDKGGIKAPHVRGLVKCGGEGNYMYLPADDFVLKIRTTNWGSHDRVIMHEWGHLRWGLFDEYPVKNKFYQADGIWKPTSCTENIKGRVVKGECNSTEYCNTDNTGIKMDKKCTFCPDVKQSINASLMSYSYLNKISMFCDKKSLDVHESQWHNIRAPNLQNLLCNQRSAWEVMRMHKDFQESRTMPLSTDTRPKFEIVQDSEKYRVFVLDTSGSMSGEKLTSLRQSGEYVIQEVIPQGSWLGIVVFNGIASTVKNLTQINTKLDRKTLAEALPTSAGGSTCIGCGIVEAIKILKSTLKDVENTELIVISDGENTDGDLELTIEEAVREKVIIYTIAITQQADTVLANISQKTSGKHYTYLQSGNITFADSLSETITGDLTSERNQHVSLVSEKLSTPSNTIHFNFTIEDGIGSNTSITVVTNMNQDLNIEVVGPNNFSQSLITSGTYATLSFPGIAMVGLYEVGVSMKQGIQSIEYYVKSMPTNDDVVKITSWLSTSNVDMLSDELPAVFVDVKKGFAPVINANVSARVESDVTSCELSLADNGMDPDIIKNDGVYTCYLLPSCLGSGRVNVKGYVRGFAGETKSIKKVFGAPSIVAVDEGAEAFKEDFQRVQVLEELYVSNYKDSGLTDIIAPGRITDVNIYNIVSKTIKHGESRHFTITWTATGDDKSIGQASTYVMRISDHVETLLHNFDSADLLKMENVTLTPQEAGTTEALKIVVDAEQSYTKTAFFALKAVDEAGNAGKVSNIVPIVVANGYRAAGENGSLEIETVVISENRAEDISDKGAIIGKTVGGLVGCIIPVLVVVIVIYRTKRNKRKKSYDVQLAKREEHSNVQPLCQV